MANVNLTQLIDFNLLKRYDSNMKTWVHTQIASANEIIFTTKNSLPTTGKGNVLYVTEDSLFLWNGVSYIQIGGSGTSGVFIPSINADGDLSWTNDAGLPNPDPVNIIGPAGKDGIIGKDGKSAYEIATENGFTGSEADWLESLKGQDGANGASFTIKGLYATYDDLIAAHPTGEAGDAYAVGDADYNEIYNWSVDKQEWENLGSLEGPPGPKGEDSTVPGPAGEDGVSPTITIIQTEDGVDVTITDVNGDQTFSLTNGAIGEDGENAFELAVEAGFDGTLEEWIESLKGETGADGYSPVVSLAPTTNGTAVTITDKNGNHVFEIENGEDGFSPTVEIDEDIPGKHVITITDATGEKTATVVDGKRGVSVSTAVVNEDNHLSIVLSDGTVIDAGKIDVTQADVVEYQVIDVELYTSSITFDGTSTTFDLPTDSKTLTVYINGLALDKDSDYTITDGAITFSQTYDENDRGTLRWLGPNTSDSDLDTWGTKSDIDAMFS